MNGAGQFSSRGSVFFRPQFHRTIGAHFCTDFARLVLRCAGWAEKLHAGLHQPTLHQRAKGDARLRFRALRQFKLGIVQFFHAANALHGGFGIIGLGLNADKMPPQLFCHRASRAGAEKRVEHHITGLSTGQQNAMQQAFRLLRRVQLSAALIFQTLAAGANRQAPIRAHLHIIIQRLHGLIIERIAGGVFVRRGPNQRFMRIGEARATKIRHRIGFAPNNIVQNPIAEILQRRADAENIMIGADDPKRAGRLQNALRFAQPSAGESVISGEIVEFVPLIIYRIDF